MAWEHKYDAIAKGGQCSEREREGGSASSFVSSFCVFDSYFYLALFIFRLVGLLIAFAYLSPLSERFS